MRGSDFGWTKLRVTVVVLVDPGHLITIIIIAMSKPAPCPNRVVVYNRQKHTVELVSCPWPDGWLPHAWSIPGNHDYCNKPITHSISAMHEDLRRAGFSACPCGKDINLDDELV